MVGAGGLRANDNSESQIPVSSPRANAPLRTSHQRRALTVVLHTLASLTYSYRDWRGAPQGAFARGEETGAAGGESVRVVIYPGSDRRVRQRPEEPTPVANIPSDGEIAHNGSS